MIEVKVIHQEPEKQVNEVFEYLIADCGAHRFPFIIENAPSVELPEWDSAALITGAIKNIDGQQFEAHYTILKGKFFGKIIISKNAAWKFSKAIYEIKNSNSL